MVGAFAVYGQTNAPVDEELIPLNQDTQTTANNGNAANPVQQPKFTISTWDYVRMLLVLACVIGAIYLIFIILKKGIRKKLPQNDVIKLLSSHSLPGNSQLYLVEVGTNIFFVGSGDGKVNLLAEIKDKESIDTIRLETARINSGKKQSFSDTLLRLFKTNTNTSPDKESGQGNSTINLENKTGENPIDFIKRQRNRLENLR